MDHMVLNLMNYDALRVYPETIIQVMDDANLSAAE